jgi:hypothetical protein
LHASDETVNYPSAHINYLRGVENVFGSGESRRIYEINDPPIKWETMDRV